MKSVHQKIVRWGLTGALVWLVALFLCTDWVVKSGRLAPLINENQDDVKVSYDTATGSLFTNFHFVNLRVKGEDSHVRWNIHIEKALISPSLIRLPRKIFHTSKLHGSGFSFNLEFKDESQRKDSMEKTEKNGHLDNFRIQIGDIQLSKIKDLTIGKISYLNDGVSLASLKSGFRFWPEYELEIGPSRLELKNSVTDRDFKLDFNFQLAHLRFHENPGFSFFKKFSGDLLLHANLKGERDLKELHLLNFYFHSYPWLKIEGKKARLDARIKIEKGVLAHQSHADLGVESLKFKAGPFVATGSGQVVLQGARLLVDFQKILIQPLSLRGSKFQFTANAGQFDLANPLVDLDLAFDVHSTRMPNIAVLNPWFSKIGRFAFQKGACDVGASLKLSTRTNEASGEVSLKGQGLVMKLFDTTFESDLNFIGKLKSFDTKAEILEASTVEIALKRFKLTDRAHQDFTQVVDWWGSFKLSDFKFYFNQDRIFSGKVNFTGRDGHPIFLTLKNAKVLPFDYSTLTSLRGFHAQGQVHVTQTTSQIKAFTLRSDTLQAQGDLEFKKGTQTGWVNVQHPLKSLKLNYPEATENKRSHLNARSKIK